ncbi:MAG: hypothetical protein N3D10_00410 [Candidatus Micrarchaeota archaeon]|nr:hypothetical protein [Candidatus Micrarchaeota archaeon]
MPTISHLVENYIKNNLTLKKCLERDIISYHKLARYLKEPIEKELGKEVQQAALVMAISRVREKLGKKESALKEKIELKNIEVGLKTKVFCIDLRKNESLVKKIEKIQQECSSQITDIFSITQSTHELTIVAQEKYYEKIMKILADEKKLNVEQDLSVIVLRFGKEILYQPGFFDWVISYLSWEEINIYQIVSTLTELLIIVKEEDSPKAYSIIMKMLKTDKQNKI